MPVTEEYPELVWRCDGCQRYFESRWDPDYEDTVGMPALMTDHMTKTWCDDCRDERFGPGIYEPA